MTDWKDRATIAESRVNRMVVAGRTIVGKAYGDRSARAYAGRRRNATRLCGWNWVLR